ncbi:MAG: hypothetical protein ACR2GH_03220 [Pseudonocardia sp.]
MSLIQTGILKLGSSNATELKGGNVATFTEVKFPAAFPAGSTVIVTANTQTFVGQDTPGIRIANVTESGFFIRLNELVGAGKALGDGKHAEETVGWIASTV